MLQPRLPLRPSPRLGLAWAALMIPALAIAACSGPGSGGGSAAPGNSASPGSSEVAGGSIAAPLQVIASTTVFAQMVQELGGGLVNAQSLVPANGDVHTFAPKPSDVQKLAKARLVVMNGLGLDDWLDKIVANAAPPATPVLKLGVNLPGVTYIEGEDAGTTNPHLWLNVAYAERYAERITAGLKHVDPPNAATYDRLAAVYLGRLRDLDAWVRQELAAIPESNRKVVMFHDAFPYYAQAYGLAIVGVAVSAPGQDPSAGDTADLVKAIREAGVKAIFSEAQFPARLVQQLAAETGTNVVSTLYDDALGDPPITTYEAVIRWDTEQFVAALR